jgi:hypothetical protein
MMLIEPPTVMLLTENGKASNAPNEALPNSEIALPPIVLLIRRQSPLPPSAFLFRPIVLPSVVPPRSGKKRIVPVPIYERQSRQPLSIHWIADEKNDYTSGAPAIASGMDGRGDNTIFQTRP